MTTPTEMEVGAPKMKARPSTASAGDCSHKSMGDCSHKSTAKVFSQYALSSAASNFFEEVEEDHFAETSWPKISYIIVANFLGAGVLSIPFAASQLGYILFVAFLTAVYLESLLSGKAFYASFQPPSSRARWPTSAGPASVSRARRWCGSSSTRT